MGRREETFTYVKRELDIPSNTFSPQHQLLSESPGLTDGTSVASPAHLPLREAYCPYPLRERL